MRDLPDLTTENVLRVRGQLYGALSVLRDNEHLDLDEGLQTIVRMLEVGIELSDHLAEMVDDYTTIVGHDQITREREAEGAEA